MTSRVCGRHAYGAHSNVLVNFSPTRWQDVYDQFEKLKNILLRNDASLIVLPSKVNEGITHCSESYEQIPNSDDNLNKELASNHLFTNDYITMADWIKFHSCLGHLQPQLHNYLITGRKCQGAEDISREDDVVVFPQANVLAFQCVIGFACFFHANHC